MDFADFVKSGTACEICRKKKRKLTENKMLAPLREPAVLRVLQQPVWVGNGICLLEGLLTRWLLLLPLIGDWLQGLPAMWLHPSPPIGDEGWGCMIDIPHGQSVARGGTI